MEEGHRDVAGKVVVVAIKATSKDVSKAALLWALTHLVLPGDHVKLLVIIPSHHSNRKDDIVHSCSQMVQQLHGAYDPLKIRVRIKALSGSARGTVATEAKKAQSNWLILDKHLKDERKNCLKELQCNVVLMKNSQPKVLRLNLMESPKRNTREPLISSHELDISQKCLKSCFDESTKFSARDSTPDGTPDVVSPLTVTDFGTSSISSSDVGSSYLFSGICGSLRNLSGSECDSESEKQTPSESQNVHHRPPVSTRRDLVKKTSTRSLEPSTDVVNRNSNISSSRNIRNTVSISQKSPLGPPPLCSMCQHKAPAFGNPPRWFTYAELEVATSEFAQTNFLAEGGFGSVHRGILPDGQVVAVKQYKLASTQGDQEFCSEVEVLSCAQHRNVVMLIGFCMEGGRRLLVYEYICNGSLDSHLYGRNRNPLKWSARQKIAVGAARGLRYLHEECRVGCIARNLLRKDAISELVDPCLRNCYSDEEVHRMLQCASLCLKHDLYVRPRMSQVLRVLEGDVVL
ncbi:Inactive protein kinase [Cucurbita argyrosperma subsp. argyrosperma]|nr:Inactive protein kinase [Cucurbita argyrosperma subsp. argyrosperma]